MWNRLKHQLIRYPKNTTSQLWMNPSPIMLLIDIIKNKRIRGVRIIKPDSIVAVGINLPMEHAVYDACWNMMEWLRDEYSISHKDMYIRMSCDPAFRIRTYQMVRAVTIQHVVGAEYPKERLSPAF